MGLSQLIEYSISDFFAVFCCGIFIKRRCGWRFTSGMLALNWVVLVSMEYLRFWLYRHGIVTRSTVILGAGAGFVIALIISEYRDSRTVFTLLMSISYCMFGNLAAKLLNFLEVPFLQVIVSELTIHLGLLYLLTHFLRQPIRNLQQRYRKEWRLFSMVLGMLSCCMFLLNACLKRPDARVFHHVVPLFYLVCVYVMITLALLLLVRIDEEETETSQRRILDVGKEVLKREVEQVHHIEKKIAAYNHDSRHFNRIIAGMMAEGNYDGVENALKELPSLDSVLRTEQYCENLAFNGVLSSYAGLAKEQGIDLEIQAAIPEYDNGRNWEYAVIFENLLGQAVGLSSRVEDPGQRKIHVRIVPENGHMRYEIRNTFAGTILFDRDTRLPVFSGLEYRGFDMKSVRFYVERWKGTLDCSVDGEWYRVRMLV